MKWGHLGGCFFVELPEISELEEVAHLSGGRASSPKKEDSAEFFSP